jgi:hypothetical protein
MDKLKLCPFCNKPFVLKATGRNDLDTRFEHDSPGCPLNEQDRQIIGLSIGMMTAALNNRPIEDAQAAEIERLRAALEQYADLPERVTYPEREERHYRPGNR